MTFGTPGIGPEGTLALSKWLANNTTLTILDLTDNNLGNEGAVAISNALTSGLSIKTLTLPSNKIGVDGITALSKALNVATKLTSVQLENNIIGSENGKLNVKQTKLLNDIRAKMGMVFQQFNVWPHLTVLDNVIKAQIVVAKRSKDSAESKAIKILSEVGLKDKIGEWPDNLSGGQKQA